MSRPETTPSSGPGHPAWFRLGSGSPLIAILVGVTLVTVIALLASLLLQRDHDIEPSIDRPDPILPALGARSADAQLALAIAHAGRLAQLPPTPASPTATPTRTARPVGGGGADELRLAGDVTVPLPHPWRVRSSGASSAFLYDGRGGWFSVRVVEFDPTQPSSDLLNRELARLVSPETYTRVVSSGVDSITPFGELASWSAVGYTGVRTDPQGSVGVGGNAFALVRRDGLALVLATELTPAADWDERVGDWEELFTRAAASFARAPLA